MIFAYDNTAKNDHRFPAFITDSRQIITFCNKMTNAERASELRRLRGHLGGKQFRMDLRIRREILGRFVPLLNFNQVYHTNVLQFADMMSQEGFSSRMYESCEGRLDVLVGQAINELEHDLTPPGPPQPGLVPTPHLTNEQGLWWFFQQCTTKTRWWMIVSAAIVLGAAITAAYFAGRNLFINQVIDLWRQSTKP